MLFSTAKRRGLIWKSFTRTTDNVKGKKYVVKYCCPVSEFPSCPVTVYLGKDKFCRPLLKPHIGTTDPQIDLSVGQ